MTLPAPGRGDKNVLVTGASGQIGVFAIPYLLAAGFEVFAVSRNGRPKDYPRYPQVNWMTPAAASRAVNDCQYFLSAGPLQLARNYLTAGRHFRTAVVFSSSSVISKQNSANRAENAQIQGMLTLESELHVAAKHHGVRLLILRPTLIYGCGLDASISRLARWIRRFGFMPVNTGAIGLRQPVHAQDLASVAVTALLCEQSLPPYLLLAGGSTLSYADMVIAIFAALEKPSRLLRLPEWLYVLLLRLLAIIKPVMAINSEMVRRQNIDLVFDDSPARELLNYQPRPFKPTLKDFEFPRLTK